jgi:hypothetical protein
MQPEERLEYEARVRNRQVVLAAAAGILLMIAVLIQLGGPHVTVSEQTLGLVTEDKRFARDVIGAVANALGSFALAWTLGYLFGATRARDPNVRPAFIGIFAVAGGVISGISVVVYVVGYGLAAHHFVTHGSQTYPEAHALLTQAYLLVPQLGNDLGLLLVAVSLVLVSLNAMRVGLLTRFMGYLGILAGILTILPLVPIPIVEAYWLLALAYLMSGRWPSGVPPAWSTGRAERWPSAQAMRAERGQPVPRGGRAKRPAAPAPQPVGAPASSRTRSTGAKRKRKRRK